VTDKIKEL